MTTFNSRRKPSALVTVTSMLNQSVLRRLKLSSGRDPSGNLRPIHRSNMFFRSVLAYGCGRRDLNPHGRSHQNLNLACLPVPPRPLIFARRRPYTLGVYLLAESKPASPASHTISPVPVLGLA